MRALIPLLWIAALAASPAPASAQSAADSAAVRAAALDYIQGWYTGDAARMERALHPQLAKRIVETDRETRRSVVGEMTAQQLVEGTRRGGGTRTPADRRRDELRILDMFGATASVRVDAASWVDYLHLGRVNGEWKIINVLWERRPREAATPSRGPR